MAEWERLIRYVNKEKAYIVGEYREYETEEHFVLEYRSDREVALLSDTLQWMKNEITNRGYEFEFELGTSGFIIKVPKTKFTDVRINRIKREIMSMASWLYSKHAIPGEEEEEESAIPAEPSDNEEPKSRW